MYISLCSALVLFFSYCQLSVKSGLGCSGPFYIMVSQSHLSSIHLFMHASTHPSVYPSMCPSICLCTCLSFHPPVCSSTCVTVPLSVSSCHHLIIQRPVVTLTVRPSGVVYLPTNSPSAFSGGSAKETGEGAENRFHFKLLKKWGMSFTLCSVSSSRFHRVGGWHAMALCPSIFCRCSHSIPRQETHEKLKTHGSWYSSKHISETCRLLHIRVLLPTSTLSHKEVPGLESKTATASSHRTKGPEFFIKK